MDYRLALLLHVPLGLKIENADLDRLLDPTLDPFSIESVQSALTSAAARDFIQRKDWVELSRRILTESSNAGIRWVHLGQEDYPERWRELAYRPVIFSFQGEKVWQKHPILAVVGSRTPATDTLLWMQRELSEFLRLNDIGVVSGGARGVDQWAHRLALDSERPTVCILPSGLLNPYPFGREDLWRHILDSGGCMLSTCGLHEPMRKSFFHIRNRWIAGLADVCFVAEANRRSGSLLTAKLAIEEHKTVCTLPVFPTATQGLGNLDLISEGAAMIRDHQDLMALWNLSPTALQNLQRKQEKNDIDQPQAD